MTGGCGWQVPELDWNFFASYHGHSLADTHAAHAKKAVIRFQLLAQHRGGVAAAVPSDAEAVRAVIQNGVVNSTPMVLPPIQRPPRMELRPLKDGIKRFHQFRFPAKGWAVECRELSGQGKWQRQDIVPKVSRT